jgi:hypothetical protein
MAKYDFMVAGKWRNHVEVKKVLGVVRAANKTAYCFIENHYKGEKVEFSFDGDIDAIMRQLEGLELNDPLIKKIFDTDMTAEVEADSFLLVLPAGISGHIEAGVAYGLGKKCYAVGTPEKTETLYRVFDQIFPDIEALQAWIAS